MNCTVYVCACPTHLPISPAPILAEYIPKAKRVSPNAVADTLSQSVMNSVTPWPIRVPAALLVGGVVSGRCEGEGWGER